MKDAIAIAKKMRAVIAEPIVVAGMSGPSVITASIGVAIRAENERAEQLLRRADSALYRAKRDGRDRVCTFDPGHDAVGH